MTIHRHTDFGGTIFTEDMTPERALDFVRTCERTFPCYVERFTQLRVIIYTPSQHTRTEFTGPLFHLYPLVLALRHARKPAPCGVSSRAAAVQALGDRHANLDSAKCPEDRAQVI